MRNEYRYGKICDGIFACKIQKSIPSVLLSILWGTTKPIESCRILFVRMSKLVSLRGRASSVHSDITSDTASNSVVRNGKQSTLGYQPDVWKKWE